MSNLVNIMDIAGLGLGKLPAKSTVNQTDTMILPQATPTIESGDTGVFAQFFPKAHLHDDAVRAPEITAQTAVETDQDPETELDPTAVADSALPDLSKLVDSGPLPPDEGAARPQARDDAGVVQTDVIPTSIKTPFDGIPRPAPQSQGPVQPAMTAPENISAVTQQQLPEQADPLQKMTDEMIRPGVSAVIHHGTQQVPDTLSPKTDVNVFAPPSGMQAAPIPAGRVRENIFRGITVSGTTDDAPRPRDTAMPRVTKRYVDLSQPRQQSNTNGTIAPLPNGQIPPPDTPLHTAGMTWADDSAELVQTILRETSAPQNAGTAQPPRLPVTAQIIQSLPQQPPQTHETYDVDLSPKDLGKLRISLTPQDSGISVTILCDVDSTAQLARRHADHLVRDLMQMGYASVDIDVSGQNANTPHSRSDQTGVHRRSTDGEQNMPAPTQQAHYGPHPSHKTDGIDVKV